MNIRFLSRLGSSKVITPDKRNAMAFIYIANSGVLAINNAPAIDGPITGHADPIKLRNELKRCLCSTSINFVILRHLQLAHKLHWAY